MTRFIFALVIIACALHGGDATAPKRKERPEHLPKAVPGQRDIVQIGDSEYYFALNVAVNYFDAQIECTNINMTLVSVQSLEKYEMFLDFLTENPSYDYWMWTSGHRDADNSTWEWSSTREPFTYLGWASGEPDVQISTEDCADFSGFSNGWEDDECELWEMSYICEPKPM